ncbi:spermine oxidase-like [Culicoides brevitarsis]|uniref:spermine oxidase-like n=1 Tax=Culicoides brevitarsis TaxID=469753 RepID=UPI00307C502B
MPLVFWMDAPCGLKLVHTFVLVYPICFKSFEPSDCCPESTREVDILILGAGAAGLAAARTIKNHDPTIDFLILEANNIPGGRIKNDFMTNVDPEETELVEISAGAQWLHAVANPLHDYAEEKGLLTDLESDEGLGVFLRDDHVRMNDNFVDMVYDFVGEILEDVNKFANQSHIYRNYPDSLNEFLDSEFEIKIRRLKPRDRVVARQILDWHKRFLAIDWAANDFKKISAKEFGRFWLIQDSWEHINFRNGFAEVMHLLAEEIGPEKIEYNKLVEKIYWGIEQKSSSNSKNFLGDENKQVLVKTADGSFYLANHVIVTFSLGVLKRHHETMFEPKLPLNHKEAIECLGFGAITKIFLQYEYNFWRDEEGLQFVYRENEDYEEKSWIRYMTGFDKVISGKNMFLGWVGQQGTVEMEKLSDKEIIDELVGYICKFTKRRFPYPKRYYVSRWHNNPLTLGSYSYASVNCDSKGLTGDDLARPLTFFDTWGTSSSNYFMEHGKPLLLFAGEGVSEHYFSCAHGAYYSGESQANVILAYKSRYVTQTN